ncbi:MAG TPA: F0F1 ATP synthase subunit A [Gemmatimonadaceae bacterium]|nr:F0F1 ATP synthase subunit A [Gemmatimonadaceae bacterium]
MLKKLLFSTALFWLVGSGLGAQGHEPAPAHPDAPAKAAQPKPGPATILMPHLTDSKHFEYPCFKSLEEWACGYTLPTWPVHIGGRTFDMGPTKHVIWLLISATVVAVALIGAARAHARQTEQTGHPRGFAAVIESTLLYLRDDIYMPVLGHGGEKYVPYCLTLFFFILVCNAFGLVPWASTATGNLGVTATLASITFVMVEVAGMRALGKGYINTIVYWPHDMSLAIKLPLTIVMTPIELISKFTKPFALTIRLFANMIAGHVIILSLIGLIFLFGFWVVIPSLAMALFISGLEMLVVLIQAFIFSLLAAVFIGQIRTAHH